MKIIRKRGDTSNIFQVFIQDSSSTVGAGLAGLAFNTASLTAYFHRDVDTTATAITLATMTVGTFTSSGFKEIDATNMPGWYQFCPPDTALAVTSTPHSVGFHLKGATNMAPLALEVQLIAADVEDTVRLGLTALPNAAANAAGGLPISTAGALDLDEMNVDIEAIQTSTAGLTYTVSNQVDVNVLDWKSATAPAMTGDAFARLGAPAGASVSADIAAVKVDTAAVKVQTDKLAFTVANQVDSNVIDWKSATAPAMTGDAFARLGAPAGASVSVDVAAVKTDTAAVKVQTDKMTFTVANQMDSNILSINGDGTSAASFAKTTRAIGRGTVSGSPTTTSIPTSAFTPAGAVADQFKGLIIQFDANTATTALRSQATDITASSNASTPTFTVTALTTAPASGDTFSIL